MVNAAYACHAINIRRSTKQRSIESANKLKPPTASKLSKPGKHHDDTTSLPKDITIQPSHHASDRIQHPNDRFHRSNPRYNDPHQLPLSVYDSSERLRKTHRRPPSTKRRSWSVHHIGPLTLHLLILLASLHNNFFVFDLLPFAFSGRCVVYGIPTTSSCFFHLALGLSPLPEGAILGCAF